MYTFFIPFLFILISCVTSRSEYRYGRSSEPKIFSTCIEHLGCVDTNEKWYDKQYRPLNLEPLERHTIRTEFLLMKASANGSKDILYDILTLKPKAVEISGFKAKKKTFFLIHDFTSNGHTGWIKHIAIAITEELDSNIITVDWEAGAEPPFDQAISNARIVALETEAFIKMITSKFDIDPGEIHMIGHGVGAHIAGYVGKSFKGIGRITALDPTGPRFENMPSLVRLDPDDAKYVEVLHTEAFNHRSQGTLQPMGHSDFYINNAAHQPGCNETNAMTKFTDITRSELREGKILSACSHKRAFKYYISAITTRECKFVGIACNSHESFMNGSCSDCENSICATFDMCPPPKNVYKTRFFLNTHSEAPFCMFGYQVNISIESNENSKKADGYFEFILTDVNNKITFSAGSEFGNTRRTYVPGVTYTLIIYAPPPAITDMKEAKVRWRSGVVFPFPKKPIYVKYISVKRIPMMGESVPLNGMCPESGITEIKDSAYIQFVTCNVARIQEEQRIAALTTLAVKVTTMASTITAESTTVVNVTWTLANATTTTPKPPIQCLTPGPSGGQAVSAQTAATSLANTSTLVPTKTPLLNHTKSSMATLGGAAAMLSNMSVNGSLGTVQTICYTLNVPDNATLKPEELTNLVFFDKHTNKTTIPAKPISTVLSTTMTYPSSKETLMEEEEQKENQTEKLLETSAISVTVSTPTISEETLEGFQTEVTATATTPIEEVENEALITSVSTAAQTLFGTTISQGTGATVEMGMQISVSNSPSTLHEQTSTSTHEVVESTTINTSTLSAEYVETTSEATETTTSSIPITTEELQITTISSTPKMVGEVEVTTMSNIPTMVETTYESIHITAISNVSVSAAEIVINETTSIHVETTTIPFTNPTEAHTEETSLIRESTAEELQSSTLIAEVTEIVSIIENATTEQGLTEAAEIPYNPEITKGVIETSSEITASSNSPIQETLIVQVTEIVSMIENVTAEQGLTEAAEIPYNSEVTEGVTETSSERTASSNPPIQKTASQIVEGQFGRPQAEGGLENETSKSLASGETTIEAIVPTEALTAAQMNESSSCTEWNVTELITKVEKEEFTYVVRFTEEKSSTSAQTEQQNLQVTEQNLLTTEIVQEKPSLEITETTSASSLIEITPLKESQTEEMKIPSTISYAVVEETVEIEQYGNKTEFTSEKAQEKTPEEKVTYIMHFTEGSEFLSSETQQQQISTTEEQAHHTKYQQNVVKGGKMGFLSGQIISHNESYEEIIKEQESSVQRISETTGMGAETNVISSPSTVQEQILPSAYEMESSVQRISATAGLEIETSVISSPSTVQEQMSVSAHEVKSSLQEISGTTGMGVETSIISSPSTVQEQISASTHEVETSVQEISVTAGMGVETSIISNPSTAQEQILGSTHEIETSVQKISVTAGMGVETSIISSPSTAQEQMSASTHEAETSVQEISITAGMGVETSIISSPSTVQTQISASTHEAETSVFTEIASESTKHIENTVAVKTTKISTATSSTTITSTAPTTTKSSTTMTTSTTTESTTRTFTTAIERTTTTPSATITHRTSRRTTTRPKTKTTTTRKRISTHKMEHEKQKKTEHTTECITAELPECDEVEE